jgi:lipopolysaccharide transport system ATP-binding protein
VSDLAVSVQELGKRYRITRQREPYGRLTESLAQALRAPFKRIGRANSGEKSDWFWALRDVSFDLRQGDVIGVIGRNGAGKTTLLKVLSRITEPSAGRAVLYGRVGSLLEVGTGFHPELTGRENVFMSGAVLGMRRAEIVRKFDEIVGFAGVEGFLDTPVKRYSSGMQVRLGFAVAAHLEPEILFVDEVLAVGDLAFQEKCLGKISAVAGEGRTVIFVSHNMGAINTLCPTSMWLEDGRVREIGPTDVLVPSFVKSLGRNLHTGDVQIAYDPAREAQVRRARILSDTGELMPVGECSEPLVIELEVDVRERLRGMYAYLEVRQQTGTTVMMSDSFDTTPNPLDDLAIGVHIVRARIPRRTLGAGTYDVVVSLASISGREFQVDTPGVVASFALHDSSSSRGDARPGFFSTQLEWSAAATN